MPVIKSAKKQMRKKKKKRARNFPLRSELKTSMKKFLTLIKEGSAEEAEKFMNKAYSVIDMADKKNIIHSNNAARKKSRLARALNELKGKAGSDAEASKTKSEAPEKKTKAAKKD